MSEDIRHECGVAALYALDPAREKGLSARMPGMLLDLQTRGQLAAGISSFNRERPRMIETFKDVGTVSEVFRVSHPAEAAALVERLSGSAIIGHTRYATTGADEARYAQPFERYHGRRWKWFSFAFNGTLSNYTELRQRLLAKESYHFTLDDADTEIIMHSLAYRLRGERAPSLKKVMSSLAKDFDGAYVIAFIDGLGRMFLARDPLGLRPLNYAVEDGIFAAANESVALRNAGFSKIEALRPGEMITLEGGQMRVDRFAPRARPARCFFEWIYFSNVASRIDGAGVYTARAAAGRSLAEREDQPLDDSCIVVPVPDTAKAAADAYAYALGVPCMEGIIRNRYVGRTFIEPGATRALSVARKYTPLPSVLQGKRVFLVEDSIVRSTTLKALVGQLREVGGAAEVHVRVACPPIVAPCFYGIDLSTLKELFAAQHVGRNYHGDASPAALRRMASAVGIDSLRYLAVDDLAPSIGVEPGSLCLGCVTGEYPTAAGNHLMTIARKKRRSGTGGRVYG